MMYLLQMRTSAPVMSGNMIVTRLVSVVAILGIFWSSPTHGLLAPGNIVLEAGLRTSSSRLYILKHEQRTQPATRSGNGMQPLRAAASDDEGDGGGFVNPYTAFRKWQKELIDSNAKGNDKYPEAFEGLMKEPGMTKERAERLAKLAVTDPILYAIERRKEANELTNTKMDYNKISGFFPMEWIMSGDFGWGYNKKRRRLAEEAKRKKEAERK